ncbi:MAG: riboflavin synthase [Thermoplasmata archaeon]|nr:MAG: riboflavin synthase [Thermoplasmata archaeon]
MKIIGVADTTFARFDMANSVIDELNSIGTGFRIERYTVPGIKDLPVACKMLFDDRNCDMVIALGMPGPKPIDKQCAHEASMGLIQVQLLLNKHVIEVFVHEDEAEAERELVALADRRSRDHALNAFDLLFRPKALEGRAGSGVRQGGSDAGQMSSTAIKKGD